MSRQLTSLAWPAMLALLSGCMTVGPDFVAPADTTPARYRHAASEATSVSLPDEWWTVFGDPALNALEARAFRNSPSLKAGAERLLRAQALLGVARAQQLPAINANASAQRMRSSLNTQQAIVFGRQLILGNNVAAGLSMTYEIDLWGRVRRVVETADAQFRAAQSDYAGVALLLSTQVGRVYWQWRGVGAEQRILESALATRRETRELVTARFRTGFANELDLSRARVEEANAEAELHEVVRQRDALEHALAVLVGEAPSRPLDVSANAPLPTPPRIPVGLPAQLLAHRPDLSVSVANLRAANAQVGVAEAAFYPGVQLTGDFGYASRNLRELTNGDSTQFNVGPLALTLPLFDGGRNRANLAAANARYQEALADHQNKLLEALRETEDALSDVEQHALQADARKIAQESASRAYQVALTRYERGIATYLDVVDAQRSQLAADRAAAQTQTRRLLAAVDVIRATGGGWSATPVDSANAGAR
ncbi:efflux transporter outer membrane subunit [Burkholderia sp. MBR-1]|uniref:efflux transporter outer membrane subunit n=1 Tax=Burkholderia sp. MBR-1 TaxID=2732364 RepID=UPI00215DB8FB|nr:efflux transporter outer membrane subunit [Burkholderia sp. MBR-1]